MKKYIEYNKYFIDLYGHIKESNFKGIDPSAIKFNPKILNITNKIKKISNKLIQKALLYLFVQFQIFFNPLIVKKIKTSKIYYTKGLALISSALANFNYNEYKNDIDFIIDIIFSLRLGDKNLWAHNIDYYFNDNTKITTNTPNLITTYFVANAFFEIYSISKDKKYLLFFNKTIYDMLEIFPYRNFNNESICFMYTPISNYHVHNANILFSEILVKYLHINGKYDNNIIDLVRKSLKYSLDDFDLTDSIPYAGPPTRNYSMDNYHTGYVLRGLFNIKKYGNNYFYDYDFDKYINKIIRLYYKNFIGNHVYKIKPGIILKIIESHSLAEAYLIFSEFYNTLSEDIRIDMKKAMKKTFFKLWDNEKKYFYNNLKILFGVNIYDKVDMIRWSDSWMLYAIAKFIKFEQGKNIDC